MAENFTEQQRIALDFCTYGHNLLITGQCGTGKTHLLRYVIEELQNSKKVAVTASTGMASTVLGYDATTIHHWSGIGDGRLSEDNLRHLFTTDPRFFDAIRRIKEADALIIDEVGMLSASTFSKIELCCRLGRECDFYFGGLQVIASGEFKQLPPVPNYRYNDPGDYCFTSPSFSNVFPHRINLTTVVRQEEPNLIKAVNQLCDGEPDPETEEFIKGLSRPLDDETDVCRLFGTNFDTAYVNQLHLDSLPGEPVIFKSQDDGNKKLLYSCEADKTLSLKVGAPVILIRNLPGKLYNGLRGTVHHLERDKPPVINFSGRIVTLGRSVFEIYYPEERKVLATRKQYPLKLAYALTVHRAQGQTIKKLEIDCYSFFAAGQMGVALGRAQHAAGIRVLNYNPTAAHLKHPKSVYDFDLYEGVPFRDDLVCCKGSVVPDVNDHTMEIPTERGDADKNKSPSNKILPLLHQDVVINTSKECPWIVDDFIQDHESTSFLPTSINMEVKELLQKHMSFLYDHVERMMSKTPKSNEDFVSLYQKLNTFLISDTHIASCLVLTHFPKAQKLSSKMAYWIVKQMMKKLSHKILDNQSKNLNHTQETKIETQMSASAKSKVRYIAGACINKVLSRLRCLVVRNIGKENRNSKIETHWNYRLHRLLKSLRISEEEAVNATEVPESLLEIEFRQGPSRGLTHISDSVFTFFSKLHQCVQRLVSPAAFHLGGDSIHILIRRKLFDDDDLFLAWMDLFSFSNDDDDDTLAAILIQLYELVTEHFLRISIVEGLHTFKTEIPRKKKQALRSKLAAVCERKGIEVHKEKTTKPTDETLFICPACQNVCSEEPERFDENSIGCDICNNWYHFRCVDLTGEEAFLNREKSVWKCHGCQNRGRGKGKRSST